VKPHDSSQQSSSQELRNDRNPSPK
jgi:hypothetical protein